MPGRAQFPIDGSPEEIIAFLEQQPGSSGDNYVGDEIDQELERQIVSAQKVISPYAQTTVAKNAPSTPHDQDSLHEYAADVGSARAYQADEYALSFREQSKDEDLVGQGFNPDLEAEVMDELVHPQPQPPDPAPYGAPGEHLLDRPQSLVATSGGSAGRPATIPVRKHRWGPEHLRAAGMFSVGAPTDIVAAILAKYHPEITLRNVLDWYKNPDFKKLIADQQEAAPMAALQFLRGNAIVAARMLVALMRGATKNDGVKLQAVKLYFEITGINYNNLLKKALEDDERASNIASLVGYLDAEFREIKDVKHEVSQRELGTAALAATIDTWEVTTAEDAKFLYQEPPKEPREPREPKQTKTTVKDEVSEPVVQEKSVKIAPPVQKDMMDITGESWQDNDPDPEQAFMDQLDSINDSDPLLRYLKARTRESKRLAVRLMDPEYNAERRQTIISKRTKRKILLAR